MSRITDAMTLAQQRWAAQHSFDIEQHVWERFFSTYHFGDVLQAIQISQQTKSKDPAVVFQRFERALIDLDAHRNEATNPSWPPVRTKHIHN